jgi:hypothetical protein
MRAELAKAEQLKPGLPFASPHAVSELKQQLSKTTATTAVPDKPVVVERDHGGFPWVPVIVIAGLILMVVMFCAAAVLNRPIRRPFNSAYYGGQPGGPMGGPMGGSGYGGPVMAAPAMAVIRPRAAGAAAFWARWPRAPRRARALPRANG